MNLLGACQRPKYYVNMAFLPLPPLRNLSGMRFLISLFMLFMIVMIIMCKNDTVENYINFFVSNLHVFLDWALSMGIYAPL